MAATLNHSSSTLLTLFFLPLLSNPTLSSPLIDQLNQPPPPTFLSTTLLPSTATPPPSTSPTSSNPQSSPHTSATSPKTPTAPPPSSPSTSKLAPSSPLYTSPSPSSGTTAPSPSNPSTSPTTPCSALSPPKSSTALKSALSISATTCSPAPSPSPPSPLSPISHASISHTIGSVLIGSMLKPPPSSKGSKIRALFTPAFKMTTTIFLLVGVSAMAASAVGCLAWRIGTRREFSERVLRKATEGFSNGRLVEKRERVEVYGGRLKDGKEVEVKIQRGRVSSEFRRGFVGECRVLVKVRHRNLVRVLGWCDEREMRGVVMERGVAFEVS